VGPGWAASLVDVGIHHEDTRTRIGKMFSPRTNQDRKDAPKIVSLFGDAFVAVPEKPYAKCWKQLRRQDF
jgi:hypothetical protein